MRLIDADEITFDVGEFNTYDDYSVAFDKIDYAPTVNAIPIEFIEKYARLSDDVAAVFGVPAYVLKNVYRSLIDEWKKIGNEQHSL